VGCTTTQSVSEKKNQEAPFIWEAASVYFLMTDRFYNGDKSNDNKTTGKNYVVLKEVILKESQKKEFISINGNHYLLTKLMRIDGTA
jgi:hypothetical protein